MARDLWYVLTRISKLADFLRVLNTNYIDNSIDELERKVEKLEKRLNDLQ